MSKKTELVEAILKIRKKENDLAEAKYLYTLTNQQLEKIYNSESKRTEQEVLKDFEKLGYEIQENSVNKIYMRKKNGTILSIIKFESDTWKKGYRKYDVKEDFLALIITMQEHKLLTELFTILGWL